MTFQELLAYKKSFALAMKIFEITKLFPKDTVIMAIYAAPTVGRLGILNQESAFNQAAVGLIAKNKVGYPFVFLLLKYFRDEFNNLSNGAAQQNLSPINMGQMKICIPSGDILKQFSKVLEIET